ncbi:Uncharacterised protein g9126 [Pycnogonum litorale]
MIANQLLLLLIVIVDLTHGFRLNPRHEGYDRTVAKVDAFVDKVLKSLHGFIDDNNLDPLHLPDKVKSFSKKVLFVRVHGEAKLYDGYLKGLSTLHRTDECTLKYQNKNVVFRMNLGIDDMSVSYKGHAKFMNLGPTIRMRGDIGSLSVDLEITQPMKPNANPSVTYLDITDMSHVSLKFTGLGPITFVLSLLTNAVVKLLHKVIANTIEGPIRKRLSKYLAKYKLPLRDLF